MNKKVSFKKRILIYFSVIIAAFTVGIIIFEQNQIKKERTSSLERTLENNADIIYNFILKSIHDMFALQTRYNCTNAIAIYTRVARMRYDINSFSRRRHIAPQVYRITK